MGADSCRRLSSDRLAQTVTASVAQKVLWWQHWPGIQYQSGNKLWQTKIEMYFENFVWHATPTFPSSKKNKNH